MASYKGMIIYKKAFGLAMQKHTGEGNILLTL